MDVDALAVTVTSSRRKESAMSRFVSKTATLVLAVAVSATLGLAACGSSGGDSSSSSSVQSVDLLSAQGAEASLSNFQTYLLDKAGIDAQNKLNITVKGATSAQASAALVSGSEHFQVSAYAATASAIAQGLPLEIVGISNLGLDAVIVAKSSIASVSDLAGKTMVAAALGNTSQTDVIGYANATHQVDPNKIKWVVSGSTANSVQYLVAGRADAAWAPLDSVVGVLAKHPELHIIVDNQQLTTAVPAIGAVVVTTKAYAKDHHDLLVNLMTSFMQANRKVYESESYFDQQAANAFPPGTYTADQLHQLYQVLRPKYAVNGGFDKTLIDGSYQIWSTAIDPKDAAKASFTNGEGIIDTSYTAEALKKIGRVSGSPDDADLIPAT
jgi:ABC-type nitrate/sulfonate/bicarbonate transport system substrate-binding protein